MRRLFTVITVLWLAQAIAFAAGGTINCKGTVIDNEGEPIIGASISAAGQGVGTTDIDGQFDVKVPNSAKELNISYIGFKSTSVPVRANVGTVTLEPSNEILNDVVVTQSLARAQ